LHAFTSAFRVWTNVLSRSKNIALIFCCNLIEFLPLAINFNLNFTCLQQLLHFTSEWRFKNSHLFHLSDEIDFFPNVCKDFSSSHNFFLFNRFTTWTSDFMRGSRNIRKHFDSHFFLFKFLLKHALSSSNLEGWDEKEKYFIISNLLFNLHTKSFENAKSYLILKYLFKCGLKDI
jgi:hypothetical protein